MWQSMDFLFGMHKKSDKKSIHFCIEIYTKKLDLLWNL